MKKRMILVLGVLTALCLTLFAAGCGDEEEKVSAPVFQNVTADVDDAVQSVTWKSEAVFEKAELDGAEMTAAEYTVSEKSFRFACEKYGALGIGTHTVKLVFDLGDSSFTVTVTDAKTPVYTFAARDGLVFGKNETAVFPTVVRGSANQQYVIEYRVTDEAGSEKFKQNDLPGNSFTVPSLASGKYTLTVRFLRGSTAAATETVGFEVLDVDNYAAKEKLESKFFEYSAFLDVSYNVEMHAVEINKKLENTTEASLFAFDFGTIAEQVSAGKNVLRFRYYAEEPDEGQSKLGMGAYDSSLNQEGDTVYTLKKDYLTDFAPATGVWLEKEIYLPAGVDADCFGFRMYHAAKTSVYLEGVYFDTVADNEIMDERHLEFWEIGSDTELSWKDGAFCLTQNKADIRGIAAIRADWLNAWMENGSYGFRFSVKGNDASLGFYAGNHATDFETGGLKGISSVGSEYSEYFITFDEWERANPNAEYLVITLSGGAGASVSFDGFVSASAEDYAEYLLRTPDIFTADRVGEWKQASANVTAAWDAAESAVKFGTKGHDGLSGRYFAAYYDVSLLKMAKESGYAAMSFKVKADAAFLTPVAGKDSGFRIYGKVNEGLDTAGITTNATAGIYVYKDVRIAELSADDWVTVTVGLDDFFASSNDIRYFAMVVSGPVGSAIWMKESDFLTAEEYEDVLREEAEAIIFARSYAESTAGWATGIPAYLVMSFDDSENAVRFDFKADRPIGAVGSADNYARLDMTDIKSVYNTYGEYGAKYLKFSYRVDSTYAAGPAFIKLIGTATTALDNYDNVYRSYYATTADTWVTEYISLDAFFGMKTEPTMFNFLIGGPAQSYIMFKDVKFATETEYVAYMSERNLFESHGVFHQQEYASNWRVSSVNKVTCSFDADASGMKVTLKTANTVDRDVAAVMYSAMFLKELVAAGCTEMSFDVSGTVTTMRIFGRLGKQKVDSSVAAGVEGIYLYRDDVSISETAVRVTINLAEFLALDGANGDISMFAFSFSGNAGSTITFSNFAAE